MDVRGQADADGRANKHSCTLVRSLFIFNGQTRVQLCLKHFASTSGSKSDFESQNIFMSYLQF
jgi:hypothetical protein